MRRGVHVHRELFSIARGFEPVRRPWVDGRCNTQNRVGFPFPIFGSNSV